jgi:hypothetical protein
VTRKYTMLIGSFILVSSSIALAAVSQDIVISTANAVTTVFQNVPVTVTAGSGGGGGGSSGLLPADRDASANWKKAGMLSVGGIPQRSTQCGATVNPLGGGQNDVPHIQAAVDACPAGQVVKLGAATFTASEGSTIHISSAITLRGSGPTSTILHRVNGATDGTYFPGSMPSPIINMSGASATGSPSALTADAAQGATSVTVANASAFHVGEIVLLDENSGAGWQPERNTSWKTSCPQIWASPDYRVEWMRHNPSCPGDDGSDIFGYFQFHSDHPTNEAHQISAISGNTITFDDPVMISYRVSHAAQVTPMINGATNAGVESLAMDHGDDANMHVDTCAYCWVKDVENSHYLNDGFRLQFAYRVQLDGVYIHDAAWPVPGGAGYNISMAFGSTEVLIQNSISVLANKVMVARASGAGSVIAYNYMDDGYINGSDGWIEIGLNASHLVGPHHVLFEGNQSWNMDSDSTHGNSTYITFFRNYASGFRKAFTAMDGGRIDDSAGCCGPERAGSAHQYSYWFSFIGNVLGSPGKMSGWVYEDDGGTNRFPSAAIWTLGYFDVSPQGSDPFVATTTLRDGNYDYLNNSIKWDANDTAHTLPNSLYLTSAPLFFSGGASTWPWVVPTGSPQLFTLPAKARYDAGTPFVQP